MSPIPSQQQQQAPVVSPLRLARLSRGLSLWQVAAATGLDEPLLSRIERGVGKSATPVRVSKLRTFYGLSDR